MPLTSESLRDMSGEQLRYPIGRFAMPSSLTPAERPEHIVAIEALPGRLRQAVAGLSEVQWATPYREGGWTLRQLIHHVPDSHINAYVRFRLALTEDTPTIKPYQEAQWARLPDGEHGPPEVSLRLLEALHERWVLLLKSLDERDWARAYRHPELGVQRLDQVLALYSWHSRHHLEHALRLRQRQGW